MEGETDMLDVVPRPTRKIPNPAQHRYEEESAPGGVAELSGAIG
jgi:hypothetical protein